MLQHQISQKSIQWELRCSMWMKGQSDGQTDMSKLIVAFHSFANAPKSSSPQEMKLAFKSVS
jgi:hypothetical protein